MLIIRKQAKKGRKKNKEISVSQLIKSENLYVW